MPPNDGITDQPGDILTETPPTPSDTPPEVPPTPPEPEAETTPDPETPPEPAPPAPPAPPKQPLSLTQEEWEQHQADVAELRTFKAEQERIRQEQQEQERARPPQPTEWTPQQWANLEQQLGFQVSQDPDNPGKEIVHIDRRGFIKGIMNMISRGLETQDAIWEKKLQGSTAASRIEASTIQLESRGENPLKDVRQHLPAMKEYLAKWFDPKLHADPEVLEAAYTWAKGRALAAAGAKRPPVAPARRVVQPASPRPPAAPAGSHVVSPLERAMMGDIPESEWIKARDGR